MRHSLLSAAVVAAMSIGAASASASTLLYSFETGDAAGPLDGFGPNGGGVTVTQDTIGTTDGSNSMKVSVVQGATFVGALTGNVPAALNNPPGVTGIDFDLTVGPNDPFTGAFSVLGITIFGASQPGPGQQFGLQAQFSPLVHMEGLAPGTYAEHIDLIGATNQVTFDTNQTFDQIFGSGANQQIPTGFEFFINKSADAPVDAYIDNVRVDGVPEPTTLGLAAVGGLMALSRRRRKI
jgi:hypothetical protein